MAKIEKIVSENRKITATFTQAEWNSLWGCVGLSASNTVNDLLKREGKTGCEILEPLYSFLCKNAE